VDEQKEPHSETGSTAGNESSPQKNQASDLPLVLIVEDNDDAREYLRSRLTAEFEVMEAATGVQALERAQERIPDLVVSDVMMPEMNGYELCSNLKSDVRTSHIPVILLTALADKSDKMEGLGLGADDFLVKPFDAQELLIRVRNLIANRKMMQERFSFGIPWKGVEAEAGSLDDQFLRKAFKAVADHLSDEDFSVEQFASEVFLSRAQLHRKLKALTNLSPLDFIRIFRLQRAKELLEKNQGTVAEVADMVGFTNHSYFAKIFQQQFGCLPSELPQRQ
jgi:DNA-binding response OmpR family regulator